MLVTDGPFTESVEQVVGFYLVETDDRADLVRICAEFAARGEHIEFRDLVADDHDHGGGRTVMRYVVLIAYEPGTGRGPTPTR